MTCWHQLEETWHQHSIGMSLIIGALVIIIRMFSRKGSLTLFTENCKKDFGDHPLELILIAVAVVGGICALQANTNGTLTTCRSQLYAAEGDIEKSEFDPANSKIWAIYARPTDGDPSTYCKQLIQMVTPAPYFCNAKDADDLNYRITAAETFESPGEAKYKGVEDLRKISAHLSAILALEHSAYDYWGDDVISESELRTWLGYIREIGPNPVFLSTIANWRQQGYMSRNFAAMLQEEMVTAANKPIIDAFYPDMDPHLRPGVFLKNLPEYGLIWFGNDPNGFHLW